VLLARRQLGIDIAIWNNVLRRSAQAKATG
jgi:hypothetical protein